MNLPTTPQSAEIPVHILALAERLRTQDNRATSHPVFCVQKLERIEGIDDAYGEEYAWRDEDCNEADADKAKLLELADENGDAMELRGWTKSYHIDQWIPVMTCLTEKGAADYINRKAHHLSNIKPPRIYVESAYGCQEMIQLREWLMTLDESTNAAIAKLSEELKRWARVDEFLRKAGIAVYHKRYEDEEATAEDAVRAALAAAMGGVA